MDKIENLLGRYMRKHRPAKLIESGIDRIPEVNQGAIIEYTPLDPQIYEVDIDGTTYTFLGTDGGYILEPGKPILPTSGQAVAMPKHSRIVGVEVKRVNASLMAEDYNIYPAPIRGTENEPDEYTIDEELYETDEYYPRDWFKLLDTGRFADVDAAHIIIYPYRYNPVTKKLYRLNVIGLEIIYNPPHSRLETNRRPSRTNTVGSELFLDYDKVKRMI